MSPLSIFVALSVLGCDFLLLCLFQWVYGEKRRLRHIRSLRQNQAASNNAKLRLVPPPTTTSPRPPSASLRVLPIRPGEQFAHRRIVEASLLPTRSRS